jgi:ribose/xylose/arabinose/galactoside ABC-type transport system permease subunit
VKGNRSRISNENFNRILWPLVALVCILLFNLIFTKGFFNIEIKDGHLFGSLIDILNRAAPVMLLTIGMTLVYATGGIDLSVGAVMAISGALAAYIIRPNYVRGVLEYGELAPLFVVISIPLLVSIFAGLWNGILVAYVRIQPIVATLILMVAGRGIAQLITRGQTLVFEHEPFQYIGTGYFLGLPFPVIIVLFVFIATIILTRKTSLGMFIEAVGDNPSASRIMGIRSNIIKLSAYIFCGLCAGIAGLIATADIKCADANNTGLFLELDAIAAVIIGGTMWGGRFTLAGSIIGVLIIQSLTTTILTRGVSPDVTLVFKAVVIIMVALIQSDAFRSKLMNLTKKRRVEI